MHVADGTQFIDRFDFVNDSEQRTKGATMQEQLEQLIDSESLSAVAAAIAAVCREKAEHLRSDWQDYIAAQAWDRAAKHFDGVESAVDYLGL